MLYETPNTLSQQWIEIQQLAIIIRPKIKRHILSYIQTKD